MKMEIGEGKKGRRLEGERKEEKEEEKASVGGKRRRVLVSEDGIEGAGGEGRGGEAEGVRSGKQVNED